MREEGTKSNPHDIQGMYGTKEKRNHTFPASGSTSSYPDSLRMPLALTILDLKTVCACVSSLFYEILKEREAAWTNQFSSFSSLSRFILPVLATGAFSQLVNGLKIVRWAALLYLMPFCFFFVENSIYLANLRKRRNE